MRTKAAGGWLVGALSLSGAACVSMGSPSPSSDAAPRGSASPMHSHPSGPTGGMCPMMMSGATVRASDQQGSAALAFTTTGDVPELRDRVRRMVDMHNRRHDARGRGEQPPDGVMDGGMMGDRGAMPPATARYEETKSGAWMVLIPDEPRQLGVLRDRLHRHAQAMNEGECPMMMR